MAALLLAGCNGFPSSTPVAEAARKPWRYPLYESHPMVELSTIDQLWLVQAGTRVPISLNQLKPVPNSPLFSTRWDSSPYDMLYLPVTSNVLNRAVELR